MDDELYYKKKFESGCAEIRALRVEGAGLRALVRDLKRHICRLHRDEPCAVLCDAYDDMLHVCTYEVRMRELGIEVTDE